MGKMGKKGGKGGPVLVSGYLPQQGIHFSNLGGTIHGSPAEKLQNHARNTGAGSRGHKGSRLCMSQHSQFYGGTSPSDQ